MTIEITSGTRSQFLLSGLTDSRILLSMRRRPVPHRYIVISPEHVIDGDASSGYHVCGRTLLSLVRCHVVRGKSTCLKRFQDFLEVPATESDSALRSQFLRIMLFTVTIGMIVALGVDLLGDMTALPFTLASLASMVAIYLIDRQGFGDIARLLFVLFLLVMTTLLRLIDNSITLLYTVPIVVSAVLIRPWAGIVVAMCSSALLAYPVIVDGYPLVPTAIVFHTIAVIVWLSAYGFEKSRQELIVLNEELEMRVESRTQELEKTQEELLAKERLAVLGQLSGGISHELRSPLSAILNSATFLKMALDTTNNDVAAAIDTIESEVGHSVRTVDSLLGLAKPRPPTLEDVNANELIQDILSKVRPAEGVTVQTELEPELPIISADPFQLKQAFSNLVVNAYQAMPEGGTLTVVSTPEGPDWISIAFKDTGSGIPEEYMGRLFEPLFTTKTKGIGLGLTITKMLVEAQGGKIEVESEPAIGSTFTIRLPQSR